MILCVLGVNGRDQQHNLGSEFLATLLALMTFAASRADTRSGVACFPTAPRHLPGCYETCAVRSSGLGSFHVLFPGTAVPGFPMPPLRGW